VPSGSDFLGAGEPKIGKVSGIFWKEVRGWGEAESLKQPMIFNSISSVPYTIL
jgi:hypothetical protein